MSFINLTPHLVRIMDEDGQLHGIQPSGSVATVSTTMTTAGTVFDGARTFAVSSRTFGQVQGLPEQQPGVTFIVSAMVLDHVNREDVVAPDTGATAIRKDGQVWAVRGLVRS